ncbi:Target of rapamycin complex 1 subunit kog1, partial [Kickxella alabastrina]
MTSAVAVPSDDIAPVTMGPSRGNDRDQTIITTTATGAKVDMSELLSSDPLGSQRKPVDQSLMETRMDFHTHPRSLALAHTQLADWRTHEKLRTVGALLVVCLNLGTEPPDVVKPSKRAVMEAWVDPTAPVDMPTQEELALQAANGAGQRGSTTKERSPMRAIGESILRQFEHIQKHAKYKPLLDCCMEDLRKYCVQFRRVAKEERLLFYYNGHGVPRPTPSGDLWVFNRQFTQYIPVNSMELMSWIGTPCLYVWDCAHAMNIVKAFEKNAKLRDVEIARIRHAAEANGMRLPLDRTDPRAMSNITSNIAAMMAGPMHPGAANGSTSINGQGQAPHQQNGQQQQQQQPAPGSSSAASAAAGSAQGNLSPVNPALINLALLPSMHHEDIHFAATRSDELLPTNPELPADLFTSCLTTPVKMALRFWVTRNPNNTKVTLDMCEKLPGSVQDRRTPLGEINWIFTSITDSIAWSTLPRELFRKLFRQDVVVASMYRNFMLADRVMRFYGVHPQCSPSIPPTHKHPLWDSLDLEIDMCLQQLPRLLKEDERRRRREERARRSGTSGSGTGSGSGSGGQSRYPSANSAASEFHLPLVPKLTIASGFNTMASRHGPRIGLGGAIESEDEDASDSGSDDGIGGRSLGLGHAGGGYISST